MTLLRRKFLHLFAGIAAIPLSRFAQAQVSPTPFQTFKSQPAYLRRGKAPRGSEPKPVCSKSEGSI